MSSNEPLPSLGPVLRLSRRASLRETGEEAMQDLGNWIAIGLPIIIGVATAVILALYALRNGESGKF